MTHSFKVLQFHLKSVKQYFQNQEEHHRKCTYEDAFIGFLNAHHIPFDPRFVFD